VDFPDQNNRLPFSGQASMGGLRVPVAREIPGGQVRTSRKREQCTCPPGIQSEAATPADPANFILCISVHCMVPMLFTSRNELPPRRDPRCSVGLIPNCIQRDRNRMKGCTGCALTDPVSWSGFCRGGAGKHASVWRGSAPTETRVAAPHAPHGGRTWTPLA